MGAKSTLKITLITIILLLASVGCGSPPAQTAQPIFTPETPVSERPDNNGGVTASGAVVPAHEAQLSFPMSGRVGSVEVDEGERVEAGQVLAVLEGRQRLEAAVTSAETEVLAAQQALDALSEDIEISRAEAYQSIVDATAAVGKAKRFMYYFEVPSDMESFTPREAVVWADERLELARQAFEPYKNPPQPSWRLFRLKDETEERLEDELGWAQSDYNTAVRWLELESDMVMAQAALEKAIQDYETLLVGPDPDDVLMAEARLVNAEAALAVAKVELDQLTLLAPIEATVVKVDVYAGEAVLPGQTVITLGNLSDLRVETTDLSERDIADVEVGQAVNVYIEALDLDTGGEVISIAPQATTIGGDVVYTVVIGLDEQPAGLRWGMSADIQIDTQ